MREGLAKNLAEGIRKVSDETRLSVRQAEVVSVDTTAGVTASIDVDGVQIDDVVCFNNVVPAVGDSAWVMTLRSGRWVIIGFTNGDPVTGGGFQNPYPDDATFEQNVEVDGTLTANHIHGNLAGAVYLHVKNTSGVTIPAGSPVYATGSVGASGATEVARSECDVASTMPALGIVDSELVANAEGHATVLGVAKGLNTGSYSVNDSLYVSATGGLTSTRPTGASELVQKIGRVIRSDASTGEILVLGAGRTNDVPNGLSPTITLSGDASGSVTLTELGSGTLNVTVANDSHSHSYLPLSGGTLTGNLTAPIYYSSSNGLGTNYRLGDDCWIGDVNVANTTRLTGVQNSDRAYLQFGTSGQKLGQAGTGSLTWEGSFGLNGITLSNISSSAGSMRVNGSSGYIDVGPKNSSWCHVYTDRPEFYFNKEIRINNVRVSKEGHTHSYASTSSAVRALYHSGYGNSEFTVYQTSGNWQTWTGGWATHLICNHGNGSNYYNQTLIMPFWGQPHYMRKQGGGNVGPWVMYSSENSNNSSSNWTIGRAYVHNEVFVYNMDTTYSYNTVRYNTSNSQLMAYASLREMKDDITEINPLLDYLGERSLLYDLKPVIFKESENRIGKDGQPLHTTRGEYAPGFIAEEVHEVAPELTYFDYKGDLVSYANDALIPHVVAELQRLMPMIEELYGAANPDWVPPAPRPVERAQAEKLVYDLAAAEKAANPTVFEDQPEGSSFLEPDRDLVDPSEE